MAPAVELQVLEDICGMQEEVVVVTIMVLQALLQEQVVEVVVEMVYEQMLRGVRQTVD